MVMRDSVLAPTAYEQCADRNENQFYFSSKKIIQSRFAMYCFKADLLKQMLVLKALKIRIYCAADPKYTLHKSNGVS